MYLADTLFGRAWLHGAPLRADDFPPGTTLQRFFAWNEKAWRPDRRYVVANDVHRLLTAYGSSAAAREICAMHLGLRPVIRARLGDRLLVSRDAVDAFGRTDEPGKEPAVAAGRRLVESLVAAVGASDMAAHARVFAAFEELDERVDLGALARLRPSTRLPARRSRPRHILVIRLSAFGDFVQSLGPVEAIRRHHRGDRVTLLTTSPFADFARELGWFDDVLIDRRPRSFDPGGWLALRRTLRGGGFDRVYDLQTSQRSSAYRWLLSPLNPPEWSGIAARSSHPHANLDRDRQHTIDKQAEQLLMAGIYPTPLPRLPAFRRGPSGLPAGRDLVLIAPGSSSHRPAKRWPAARFGAVAQALDAEGYVPVVVGAGEEERLAAEIRSFCPAAFDLVGRTSISALAALAQRAVLSIGNDNGVSHLAAAADCPVVVLFSEAGSDPALCAPRGRLVRVVVVSDLDDLAAETVLVEAREVLRQVAGAAAPQPMARST
jgi:ADP-heptose:LPS heptosyltransferase